MPAEAVSRWESSDDPVPRLAFAALIAMVRDDLARTSTTRDMLRATMAPSVSDAPIELTFPATLASPA